MEEEKTGLASLIEQIDLFSMIRDLAKNIAFILLGALAVTMITDMIVRNNYQNAYSTTATMVVTSKNSSQYAFSSLTAASNMADSYSNILNSSLLRKKVCEDLNMSSFDATASSKVIQGTNLLTLRVTASTPQKAYQISRSIMRTVNQLTGYVSENMVMEVLQEPQVPTKPDSSVSVRRQTSRAFILSAAVFALGFMYFSFMRDTVKSEEDMKEKLDADSLGVLYHDLTYRTLNDLIRRNKSKHLVTDLNARFEHVERNKKIGAMIAGIARKKGARTILVTSVREHEGKSTFSANLALTLARQSSSVLLIDGDMRRPTLNRIFLKEGEQLEACLGDMLQGKASMTSVMRVDKERGISLMLNDRDYPDSTDIVSSRYMERLIEVASRSFDYIIIDSPPMAIMADAEVLAGLADLSLLVVAYDTVPVPELNDAIDALRDCKAEFIGCVLNNVYTMPGAHRTVGGYGGYGGYGKYGRYSHYQRYGKYGGYGHYGDGSK